MLPIIIFLLNITLGLIISTICFSQILKLYHRFSDYSPIFGSSSLIIVLSLIQVHYSTMTMTMTMKMHMIRLGDYIGSENYA